MSYSTLALLLVAAGLLALLGGRWLAARPAAYAAASSAAHLASNPVAALPPLPAGPLVVSTLAGHPLPPTYADGQGSAATFRQLRHLATDRQGNLYVADGITLRRVTPGGEVRTLAGQPPTPRVQNQGAAMDFDQYKGLVDGRGAAAHVSPTQLAVGPGGAVYFTDANTVRRLGPDGQVTTLAGQLGYDPGSHRDGPGAQARFDMPAGLAVAADGTVYVADMGNNVIRCISPAGVVSTLAGQPGEYGGVNGTGAAARFDHPKTLAWAPDGALLVHDTANDCLRRVTRQGEVSTWLGTIRNTRPGPEPGADADLSALQSFVVAADGTLYFTTRTSGQDHIIRRILPDRSEPVRPWAGQADARAYADAATPGAARFNFPAGLALGPDGTLYVADVQNQVLRAISPAGRVSTLAGQPPLATPDGQGLAASLPRPTGLALEPGGSLLLVGGGLLRRVSAAGAVTTLAGQPYPPTGPPDEESASLLNPYGVAVVGTTAFMSDEARHAIYQVAGPARLRVWAGRPDEPGDNDGGPARARFDQPTALAAAPDGTLYVCDREGRAVRCISPAGKVSTFAGARKTPISPLSNEGRYVSPSAVAVGPDGSVYVLQGSLRRFPAGGGAPVLLAGADEPGYADGRGAAARFNFPTGLCVAADGTVYVADRGNHLIRQVSPAGDVTTLAGQPGVHPLQSGAGQGQYRYAPDDSGSMDFTALGDYHDGPAASARFNHPAAVALGPGGVLYVADEDNNCLRVIRPAPASGRP